MIARCNRSPGFTLVELVVVVILLSVLVAVSLPRFLDSADRAEAGKLANLAGSLQEAVVFAKAQWRVEGKPNAITFPDGTLVNLDPTLGYPVDDRNQANDTASNMGVNECARVFAALLATTESITNSRNRNRLRQNDFFARRLNGPGGTPDTCVYYRVSPELIEQRPTNAGLDPRYPALVYTPGDGRVVTANLP